MLFLIIMPRRQAQGGTVPVSEDVDALLRAALHCIESDWMEPMVVFPWEQQKIMLERLTCGQMFR